MSLDRDSIQQAGIVDEQLAVWSAEPGAKATARLERLKELLPEQ